MLLFNSVIILLLVKLFHIVNHSVQKAKHHVKLLLRKAFVHGFLYYHYIFPYPVFVVQCFCVSSILLSLASFSIGVRTI